MSIFEIDPVRDSRWQTFIEGHARSSIFHRPEWLGALHRAYDYNPVVFTSSPPDAPLTNGIVFCKVRSRFTGNRLVSLPFSDHCETLVDSDSELLQLLDSLSDRFDGEEWKYLEIRPTTRFANSHGRFGISNSYLLHGLDISRPEEVLFKSFRKDGVQRKIRRAERELLRYEEGVSETHLKQFYKLLIMTRRRHHLPPQPLSWFRSLIASLGEDLRIRLAFKGNIPVAAILTIVHKDTMVYKYGCSDARYNNLGGTPFLFWTAILQAKAKGMNLFDMGRSDTENLGLIAFKEHWGAQRSVLQYWRFPPHAAAIRPESAIKYAKKLVSVAPDVSLVMLGNLLYRHIG